MSAEEVARLPCPGGSSPMSISWSTDDAIITFLHSESGQMSRQLCAVRPSAPAPCEISCFVSPPIDGDTEENLSHEEKLRRERQRLHAVGVTSYSWSNRGAACVRVMVPLRGHIYVQDGSDAATDEASNLRLVYDKDWLGGGAVDPQLSPSGGRVAFVVNGDIYYVEIDAATEAGRRPVRLTEGPGGGVTNGLADYVAQEEMDRYRGFWWSNDSNSIAFAQVSTPWAN